MKQMKAIPQAEVQKIKYLIACFWLFLKKTYLYSYYLKNLFAYPISMASLMPPSGDWTGSGLGHSGHRMSGCKAPLCHTLVLFLEVLSFCPHLWRQREYSAYRTILNIQWDDPREILRVVPSISSNLLLHRTISKNFAQIRSSSGTTPILPALLRARLSVSHV